MAQSIYDFATTPRTGLFWDQARRAKEQQDAQRDLEDMAMHYRNLPNQDARDKFRWQVSSNSSAPGNFRSAAMQEFDRMDLADFKRDAADVMAEGGTKSEMRDTMAQLSSVYGQPGAGDSTLESFNKLGPKTQWFQQNGQVVKATEDSNELETLSGMPKAERKLKFEEMTVFNGKPGLLKVYDDGTTDFVPGHSKQGASASGVGRKPENIIADINSNLKTIGDYQVRKDIPSEALGQDFDTPIRNKFVETKAQIEELRTASPDTFKTYRDTWIDTYPQLFKQSDIDEVNNRRNSGARQQNLEQLSNRPITAVDPDAIDGVADDAQARDTSKDIQQPPKEEANPHSREQNRKTVTVIDRNDPKHQAMMERAMKESNGDGQKARRWLRDQGLVFNL